MEQEQARAVLASFDTHRATAVKVDQHQWKWQPGVLLFPDSFCPNCGGAMRSNRIWIVDEKAQRLVARLAVVGTALKAEPFRSVHPHINGEDRHVCMKDTTSVYQALFLAWNPNSMYWSPDRTWYQQIFDHVCGKHKVAGGLSAELARSKEAANKAAAVRAKLVAGMLAPNEVVPVSPTERIFGAPATVQDESPIFNTRQTDQAALDTFRRPRRRPRAVETTNNDPLFDGSLGGPGITLT